MSKECSHFKSGFCFRGDAWAFRHDHQNSVRPNPININTETQNRRPPSHIPHSHSSRRNEPDQPYRQFEVIQTDFEFSAPRSSCFYSSGGSTHRYKILSLSLKIRNCFFLPNFCGFCTLSRRYHWQQQTRPYQSSIFFFLIYTLMGNFTVSIYILIYFKLVLSFKFSLFLFIF